MSIPVFPSFTAPNWNYTWPIKRTPKFSTTVQTPTSGRGQLRIANYTFPIWEWSFDIGYLKGDASLTSSAWSTLVGFYTLMNGAAGEFLFLDPFDNTIPVSAPQNIGTGNGTTTQFVFYRLLASSAGVDLIQNFVSAPVIYLNGTPDSSSNYTTDQYGNIYFNTAPGNGVVVTWSGQFYFRCRFLEDSWKDLEESLYQIWELSQLRFESVLL